METYSVNVPGRALDGNLNLVHVQRLPGTPVQLVSESPEGGDVLFRRTGFSPPRLYVDQWHRAVAPSGFQATRTVRLRDLNGNFEVVEVDTTKFDKVLTIQVQQTPAEKS